MDTEVIGIRERESAPWGFWSTVGFSCLTLIVAFVAQIVVVLGFAAVVYLRHHTADFRSLGSNGLLLTVATLISTPLVMSLSVLFIQLRNTLTVRDYLCLCCPGKGQWFRWCLSVLVLGVCSDALSALLGKPIVPDFMVEAYRTATFTPALWLAVIVAAPLGEEFVFRGFLFRGLERSRAGATGAVLLSALGWALLHIQYDLYGMGTIFVAGLLLGLARLKTRSLYVPIMMHATWSLIATIEAAIYVRMVPN